MFSVLFGQLPGGSCGTLILGVGKAVLLQNFHAEVSWGMGDEGGKRRNTICLFKDTFLF